MRDGTLLVREVRALLDVGAYVSWGSVTTIVMMETVGSLYRVPHARFVGDSVYTCNPITGAMRGFGNPQSTFWVESQMDRLAEELGMDPLEFRIRNANRPGEETPQRLRITTCAMKECLEEAGRRIGRKERKGGRGPSWKLVCGIASACAKRPVAVDAIERLGDRIERSLHEGGEREVESRLIGERVMWAPASRRLQTTQIRSRLRWRRRRKS